MEKNMGEQPEGGAFHPAVEKKMHTSGPDIGRIKDPELARDVAESERTIRDVTGDNEGAARYASEATSGKIAAPHMGEKGLLTGDEAKDSEHWSAITDSYDKLEEVAKPIHDAQVRSAAEARAKIAEADTHGSKEA